MSSLQKPINSGFGFSSTAEEVIRGVDLKNKVAIVTGGYSGIGTETARILRNAGATVIVPARDKQKAAAALSGIDVEIEDMNLLEAASIDAFANRFLKSGRKLDILINSAGIMACPLMRDQRGFELQFATNHLGHFQLTTQLWPALVKAQGARVVSVASWGHRFSTFHFDDPNFERREYEKFSAYGQSKTANVLFAVEADKRGKEDGIRVFAVHPGAILETDLSRHLSIEEWKAMGIMDEQGNVIESEHRKFKTVAQGAATSVWCATDDRLIGLGGVYCEDNEVSPLVVARYDANGNLEMPDITTMEPGVLDYAVDADNAARLWALSEQLLATSGFATAAH